MQIIVYLYFIRTIAAKVTAHTMRVFVHIQTIELKLFFFNL